MGGGGGGSEARRRVISGARALLNGMSKADVRDSSAAAAAAVGWIWGGVAGSAAGAGRGGRVVVGWGRGATRGLFLRAL